MTDRPIVLWLLKCLSVLFAFALLSSCKPTYTAAPIRGKVVDAVTKLPVAGANVLVTWSVFSGMHGHFEGNIEVKEAITNEKGEFLIEGWGPKNDISMAPMTDEQPGMLIFKPWYYVKDLANRVPGLYLAYDQDAPKHLGFYWDNKTIELDPSDDRVKYVASLVSLESAISNIYYYSKECDWAKAPKIILAVSQFFKKLSIDGYRERTMDISLINLTEGCPSLESVFGEK